MRARQADLHVKDGVFLTPMRSATVHCLARREAEYLSDLEFSDYGRDPRFLPGWWISPGLLLGFSLIFWIARLLA